MNGWLRHIALKAQVKTGFSSEIAVWSIVATLAALVAAIFFTMAAFIWLSNRYGSLTASLVLGGVFVLVVLVSAAACVTIRRRNIERARLELVARSNASSGLFGLDPKLVGVGVQIGQAMGWRKLVSLAAVGLLAAGIAREWFARDHAPAESDDPASGD